MKISYKNIRDKKLISNSFYNNAKLLFGNNREFIENFKKVFENRVKSITSIAFGERTNHIGPGTGANGICRHDEVDSSKMHIEIIGYENVAADKYAEIMHNAQHEFCHAFANITPSIFARNVDGKVKNGIRYTDEYGMISKRNNNDGKLVSPGFYGKMYNETMMDILTTMGLVAFDDRFKNSDITIDDVLNNNYKDWPDYTTAYAMFTSLTRLSIAAFSNDGDIEYQKLIDNGEGIINAKTTTKSGQTMKANDFLYGIMCDPQHIESNFDKFMGDGSYEAFTSCLDQIFLRCKSKEDIDPKQIKTIMNILPDFVNRRVQYYIKNGIMTVEETNRIVSNFNKIWNSMQVEYKAYFTQEEINKIGERAEDFER